MELSPEACENNDNSQRTTVQGVPPLHHVPSNEENERGRRIPNGLDDDINVDAAVGIVVDAVVDTVVGRNVESDVDSILNNKVASEQSLEHDVIDIDKCLDDPVVIPDSSPVSPPHYEKPLRPAYSPPSSSVESSNLGSSNSAPPLSCADSKILQHLYTLLEDPAPNLQQATAFLSQLEHRLIPVLRVAVNSRLLPLIYDTIVKHQGNPRTCLIAMSALRLAAVHVSSVRTIMTEDGGIPLILHTMLAYATDQDLINVPLVHGCVLTLATLVEYIPNRAVIAANFAPNIFNSVIKAFPTESELLCDVVSLHFSIVLSINDSETRTHLAAMRVPLRVLALPSPSRLTPSLRRTASLALAQSLAAVPPTSHARLCELQPHPVRVIRRAIGATLHDVAAHFHIWRALELLVASTPAAAATLADGKGPVFILRSMRQLAFVKVDRLHAACLHVVACVARESPVAVLAMLEEGVVELVLEMFEKWEAFPEVLLRACNVLEVLAATGNKERWMVQRGGARYAVESSISSHISHFRFVEAAMGAIRALGGAVM